MALLGVLGFVFITVVGALWEAFVVVKLWAWFIAPTFSLPMLNYPVAIGIAALVGMLTRQYSHSTDGDTTARIIQGLMVPGFCLLAGWIALQYL